MTEKVLRRKNSLRVKSKRRIRGKIDGSATRPRVSIFKSNKYFYAQAIDDATGTTLVAIDGAASKAGKSKEGVKELAKAFAGKLKEKNIDKIIYDRNGYIYHGVVASFADSLREEGIGF